MARKIVIAINGFARSGKDTVCSYVIEEARARSWRAHSISSIDPVRNMLRDLGVPVDLKTPAERALLAEVKSALERYNWWATRLCADQVNFWFNEMPGSSAICFAHMREIAALRHFPSLFGPEVETRTLLVTSLRAERVTSNAADSGVEDLTYDLVLRNDGTLDDLRAKCVELANLLMADSPVADGLVSR